MSQIRLEFPVDGVVARLAPGDTLRLALVERGSAGFSWTVAQLPDFLEQQPDTRSGGLLPGASGHCELTFKATSSGRGALRLSYGQVFERIPESTLTIQVEVR